MDITVFITLFSALSIMYLVIGLYASKKASTNTEYFLAGRTLGIPEVTFTLVATQLGGGMLLGTAEKAYTIGLYGIFYTLGISIGFLLLGLGFAAKLQSLNVATTAQLFQTKYGSPTLKKIASLLSIASMCGILIAQVIGSKALLTGIGISSEWLFLALWAFIITYTMVGGLAAVVLTDIAQVIYILSAFGALFIYCLWQEPLSFFSSLGSIQENFTSESFDLAKITPLVIIPALFSLIEQDLAQRFFAARSEQVAAISAFLSSACIIIFSCIPLYFGIKLKLLGILLPMGADPLLPAIELLTNTTMLSFAICGILAAITSTADSLLCAISSNLAQDFDFSGIGLKKSVQLSKAITLITGLVAVGTSYMVSTKIIEILISSYELSVSCLLVSLLFSYFGSNLKKRAAIYSICAGFFGFVFFRLFPIGIPKELASLALSFVAYMIGYLQKD
jgi:solute:Na+ symporter, SSS family